MVVGTTIVGNLHIKDLDLSESFKVFLYEAEVEKEEQVGKSVWWSGIEQPVLKDFNVQ